jgi:hypothetical protein
MTQSRRHAFAKLCAMLAMSASATLPASASAASDGGASAGGEPTSNSTPALITLNAAQSTLLRRTLALSGRARTGRGRPVAVERLDSHGKWVLLARASTRGDGTFATTWKTDRAGHLQLRARLGGTSARDAGSSKTTPRVKVNVYKPDRATYYGPGFFGHRTACGLTLSRSTLGVANRTLPCGTRVALYYRGRTITVPVIDRGPYANHANWDLTSATASRLRMSSTATIGILR